MGELMTGQSVKGWINNYLGKRGMSAPNGQPLYHYATRESERAFLAALLAMSMEERLSPVHFIYWAAGFCLFVADTYRRKYTAHWSWQAFDKELEVVLSPSERTELVKLGLSFWERPLRYQDQRAYYLGSLFAEGGLPWPLLQSEQHGFGRAIKAGLKENTGQDTVTIIRQFEPYFPQAFRNDNTYYLLANIVDTLKRLANEYSLDKQGDPADFLNEHAPQWREQFPLPLEEDNGVALVNEWLADAGEQLGKHRHAHQIVGGFTCKHWLSGTLLSPRLEAQVWLESSLQVAIDGHSINNTRVELALYEGGRLALKLGVDYGQVDGNLMTIRLPVETAMVRRQQPEQPLMLVIFCSGQRLDTRVIQSSEIDWQHLPAVFIEDDGATQLAGIASVQYQAAEALIRVPPDFQAPCAQALQTDDLGGHWYRINEKCVLEHGKDRYVIEPGEAANKMRVVWMGTMSSRSTLPVAGWDGWPRCQLLDAQGQAHLPEGFRVNGYRVNTLEGLPSAGRFKWTCWEKMSG